MLSKKIAILDHLIDDESFDINGYWISLLKSLSLSSRKRVDNNSFV